MRIMYLDHSGFTVTAGEDLLIFDWVRGDIPGDLRAYRAVYFFVSHAHGDHYAKKIFAMRGAGRVHYVLSDDIKTRQEAHFCKPGQDFTIDGLRVETFDSTDQGVSFLVHTAEGNIFHAGDLNFWHWKEENSAEAVAREEKAFQSALAPLLGKTIDVAFFPVDPRLGADYALGAEYFIEQLRPHLLVPMHCWGDAKAAQDFAAHHKASTRILALTRPGDSIDFPEV